MRVLVLVLAFVASIILSGCNASIETFEDGSSRVVFDNITIVIHSND